MEKNDKIIVSIGVVVLIVAAAGIFTWKDTGRGKPIPPITPTEKVYKVTWDEKTTEIASESEYTNKGEPTSLTINVDKDLITSIEFRLTWKDDKAFLGIFGKDTLSLKVTSPTGESKEDSQKAKEGNITISFTGLNSKPSISEIKADTRQEAQSELQKYITSNGKGNWNAEITVDVGELLKFRDKGNDWQLKVICHYYEPALAEASSGGGGNTIEETSQNNNEPTEYQLRMTSLSSIYKTFSAHLWL
jgi:uncharacterized protein YxeA